MSAAFLVDASIGLAWVHPAQATPETNELLSQVEQGAEIVVPALWFLEMANALLVLERRKKLTTEEREKALVQLSGLNPRVDDEGHRLAFTTLTALAQSNALSIYDATYLELAQRRKLPLGTRDEALRAAAKRLRVKLL